MKKVITSSNAPAPIGPYSQAIMVDNMLYCSGQIAINPLNGVLINDSIENETNQVMENLRAVLFRAEMDFSNVIKCTIFVSDLNNFSKINEVYGSYFDANFPARETVEVAALPKNANLEISLIAVK